MTFFMNAFSNKCIQIPRKPWIYSHVLKESVIHGRLLFLKFLRPQPQYSKNIQAQYFFTLLCSALCHEGLYSCWNKVAGLACGFIQKRLRCSSTPCYTLPHSLTNSYVFLLEEKLAFKHLLRYSSMLQKCYECLEAFITFLKRCRVTQQMLES